MAFLVELHCLQVYILTKNKEMTFTENQLIHQNDHFIVMSSQTLLNVSAYQRHHPGAHMILTSYVYVGVHYMKKN
jgi:hypothetical protein